MARPATGTAVALAVYAALVATLFTPLYEPLTLGVDQSWAILIVPAAAQVGIGAAVPDKRILLTPLMLCAAGAAAVGDEGGEVYYIFFLGLPLGLGLTALGRALGRITGERWPVVSVAALLVSLGPIAWAASETIDRAGAPHAPESIQSSLPNDLRLGNLCGGGLPRRLHRDLEERAAALIQAVEDHPDWLAPYRYYDSDSGGSEVKDITLREFAEEELQTLNGPGCDELRGRIEAVLD